MTRTTLFSIVRQKNIALILNVLHLEQVASRASISTLTGISKSTVSNIIDKLEKLEIDPEVLWSVYKSMYMGPGYNEELMLEICTIACELPA